MVEKSIQNQNSFQISENVFKNKQIKTSQHI